MYKLLSRAVEARSSCHCAICSSVRPGLARKVNTAPIRQRLRLGDVATIVYGTVLGTAAFYNGTSKKRKRKVLDNAIAGVVLENEALLADQEARLKALGLTGFETGPQADEITTQWPPKQAALTSLFQIATRPTIPLSGASLVRRFSTQSGQARGPAEGLAYKRKEYSTQPRVQEQEIEPSHGSFSQFTSFESIFPEERVVGKTIEDAWNDVTLIPHPENNRIREMATLSLVLQLAKVYLESVSRKDSRGDCALDFENAEGINVRLERKDLSYLHEKMKDTNLALEQLREAIWNPESVPTIESLPCPQYRDYDRSAGESSGYHAAVVAQEQKLVDVLLKARDSRHLISTICTFLMSQTCAPSIHIINLLLIKFLDLRWFAAARAVTYAAMAMVTNQNEVTDIAVLEYFHLAGSDGDLDRHRKCMLGADGRVTRAAFNPGQLIPETHAPEQVVIQLRERNEELVVTHGLKAGWTAQAFTVVVIDLLSRNKLLPAFAEITTMRISGLQETPDILDAFLQYSVVQQDWDVAVKTWVRYRTLGYDKSPLTWYWMLQACSVCSQPEAFQRVAAEGQESGSLSASITYEMNNFILSKSDIMDLQDRIKVLRALQNRIYIPGVPLRGMQIQHQDMIQLPNLKQTILIACLQYTKLRSVTSGWSFDQFNNLEALENDLKDLMLQLPGDASCLKEFLNSWTGYDTKVEALAALCYGSYIDECQEEFKEAVKQIVASRASSIESDKSITRLREVFAKRPPASAEFYEMVSRQTKIFQQARIESAQAPERLTSEANVAFTRPASDAHLDVTLRTKRELIFQSVPMEKRKWQRYNSLVASDVSRKVIRASSKYWSSRYWNRVLHPKSPANLVRVAIHENKQALAENMPATAQKVEQEISIDLSTCSQRRELHKDLVNSVSELGINEGKVDLSLSEQEDILNGQSAIDSQQKIIQESPTVSLGSDKGSGTKSIPTEAEKGSIFKENGKRNSHVPWQSVKSTPPSQTEATDQKSDVTRGNPQSGLSIGNLPGLVGLNEPFRYI